MADLSKLITYEQIFPIDIVNRITGEPIGIRFNVVSFDSERVVDAAKPIETERLVAWAQSPDGKLTPRQVADFGEAEAREKIIASIDSWEWGDNTFEHINAESPANDENKRFVVNHKNAKWIRDQLFEGAANLLNFSSQSSGDAENTSA